MASALQRQKELLAANARALEHIFRSGNWFAGKTRAEFAKRAFALFEEAEEHDKESFVDVFVHTTIHCQSSVTKEMHDLFIQRMLQEYFPEDTLEENDVFAAFAELVVVVSWSIGISSFYKAANLPFPPLPAPDTSFPLREPVSAFASEVAMDVSVGYSPFIKKLKEGQRHDPKWMASFSKGSLAPYVHVALAPEDTIAWIKWWEVLYIPDSDVGQMRKPSPQGRCLTRSQIESVGEREKPSIFFKIFFFVYFGFAAVGVTEPLKCAF